MNALQEFIESDIYARAKQELEAMQSRLDNYKGDKTRFKHTLSVFDELLKSNASFRIDWVVMSAEVSKLKTQILLLKKELKDQNKENSKLNRMMNEGSRPLTQEEIAQVANKIKNEFIDKK